MCTPHTRWWLWRHILKLDDSINLIVSRLSIRMCHIAVWRTDWYYRRNLLINLWNVGNGTRLSMRRIRGRLVCITAMLIGSNIGDTRWLLSAKNWCAWLAQGRQRRCTRRERADQINPTVHGTDPDDGLDVRPEVQELCANIIISAHRMALCI